MEQPEAAPALAAEDLAEQPSFRELVKHFQALDAETKLERFADYACEGLALHCRAALAAEPNLGSYLVLLLEESPSLAKEMGFLSTLAALAPHLGAEVLRNLCFWGATARSGDGGARVEALAARALGAEAAVGPRRYVHVPDRSFNWTGSRRYVEPYRPAGGALDRPLGDSWGDSSPCPAAEVPGEGARPPCPEQAEPAFCPPPWPPGGYLDLLQVVAPGIADAGRRRAVLQVVARQRDLPSLCYLLTLGWLSGAGRARGEVRAALRDLAALASLH